MEDIVNKLSLKYNKDKRVIKLICEHPLLFVKNRIKDPNDIRSIMIPYFGKFVFKFGKTLEDKKHNTEKNLCVQYIAKGKKQIQ
jgi:hypothetical protein